jgi:hypothetical protein
MAESFSPRLLAMTDRAIFVGGCPRSGTTWVQRLLASDAAICGGQESHFFTVFGHALESVRPAKPGGRIVGLRSYWDEPALIEEIRRLWRLTMRPLVEAFPDASVLVEKTPDHASEIPRILKVLPDARFIHVIRDVRGVAASMLAARQHFWGKWAAQSPVSAARWWFGAVSSARASGAPLGPDRYIEVFYEDLLANTPAGLQKLLAFCGVNVTLEQAGAYAAANTFEKQSSTGASGLLSPQGGDRARSEPEGFFNSGTADGWKRSLSLRQRAILWRHTRHLMRELGYSWSGKHVLRTPG